MHVFLLSFHLWCHIYVLYFVWLPMYIYMIYKTKLRMCVVVLLVKGSRWMTKLVGHGIY